MIGLSTTPGPRSGPYAHHLAGQDAEMTRAVRELRDTSGLTTLTERQRCFYCGHGGDDMEVTSPETGNRACRNWKLCNVRQRGLNPATELADLARAVYPPASLKDMSTLDLARLAVVIGPLRDRLYTQLSTRMDSAAALHQARQEYGCGTCGAIGYEDCTNAGGVKVRRHKRRDRGVTRTGAALDI